MPNTNLNFTGTNVLIIGDVMVDQYYIGNSTRMSPEANVPVINVSQQHSKPGGAANVANNITALGANAYLVGIVGNDFYNQTLTTALKTNQVNTHFITDNTRVTTVKNRVYNGNQYVCRFDNESTKAITKNIENQLLNTIENIANKTNINVAILQDYNKGIFTKSFIQKLIALLKKHNILFAVDPKETNFFAFQNADLFKPNLREIEQALNTKINTAHQSDIVEKTNTLIQKIQAKNVLLTLSQLGALSVNHTGKTFYSPAFKRNIIDVSGAGDTVISVAALLLAKHYNMQQVTTIANLAGGLVCEIPGVASLTITQLNHAIQQAKLKTEL